MCSSRYCPQETLLHYGFASAENPDQYHYISTPSSATPIRLHKTASCFFDLFVACRQDLAQYEKTGGRPSRQVLEHGVRLLEKELAVVVQCQAQVRKLSPSHPERRVNLAILYQHSKQLVIQSVLNRWKRLLKRSRIQTACSLFLPQ